MRLVTYRSDRGPRAGLLRDDAVLDVWDALGGAGRRAFASCSPPSGSPTRRPRARRRRRSPLGRVELLPPIPDPEKIVCIGLNYRAHAAEAGQEPPGAPDLLRQVRATRWSARAPPSAAGGQRQGRLRGRGRVRGRAAARRMSPRPTRSTTSPATRSSTTSRPATSSSRRPSGCRARSSTARRPAARRS